LAEQLGSGNFAVVKKATKTDKNKKEGIPHEVAIKIIDKSKVEDMGDIEREIEIMNMIEHKNVVNLYELYDEPKKMNLVMELVTGGELFDRIVSKGSYSEKDAAEVIFTLCDALEYLHEKKIVHRDLKPENILYTAPEGAPNGDQIKVADFGLARMVSNKDMMKTACGTPGYVAPEILKNKGYDSGAVDLWSVGVILYILLCGFPPFYEEELPALFDQILHARYDFPTPWWDNISKEAKDLVTKLLELDPKTRLTATQVKAHVWCSGNASSAPLADAHKSLKRYNAARKLKKAALGIIAQKKMAAALEGLKAGK
jgi:serine/threonine protein kinase